MRAVIHRCSLVGSVSLIKGQCHHLLYDTIHLSAGWQPPSTGLSVAVQQIDWQLDIKKMMMITQHCNRFTWQSGCLRPDEEREVKGNCLNHCRAQLQHLCTKPFAVWRLGAQDLCQREMFEEQGRFQLSRRRPPLLSICILLRSLV